MILAQEVAPITSAVMGAVGLTDPLDWRHVVIALAGCLALLLPLVIDLAKKKGWIKDGGFAARVVAIYQRAKARHDKEGGSWGVIVLEECEDHPEEIQAAVLSMLPAAHTPAGAA